MKYAEIIKLSPVAKARWYLNTHPGMPREAMVFSMMQLQPDLSREQIEQLFDRLEKNQLN